MDGELSFHVVPEVGVAVVIVVVSCEDWFWRSRQWKAPKQEPQPQSQIPTDTLPKASQRVTSSGSWTKL
nr:unnamed protein product [Digitaria exilis]